MVTPVTEDRRRVDRETLRSLTEFLVEGGVHALFPCGSIGEFSSLSREQRACVVKTVVDGAGDTPVLAGCGGTSVGDVRRYIEDAAVAGADAAVVVTPYYLNATDEGLTAFYERLLEDAALPIVLYDIPSLTGNHLTAEVVRTLADHDDVIGIKDSTGNVTYHQELIETTPESFSVLQGLAELAVASLDLGADGFVAGPANVFPESLATTYDAHESGDRERAIELWETVSNPVVAATKPVATATGLKYLLRQRGYDVGDPIPPLSPPSETDRDRLEACYQRVRDRLERPAERQSP